MDTDKENNQILRLEFVSDKKIKNFKIFAEAKEDIVLFDSPLISLQDNKVYIRLNPHGKQNTLDMADMTFTISAVLNNSYYYRQTLQVGISSDFDVDAIKLNFGLLFLAIFGGLILNFMPCVFPVISLKMMAFSKTKAKQRAGLKKDLRYTVIGIFSGFSMLIIMLWLAKYLGYSLGWGMQFQSMGFLVTMTFVVTSIVVALPVFNFNDMTLPDMGKYSGFIIGNFAVLLATPCTGPYLASAVGFALAGSYMDILVIMYGVALGLSLPYLLILALKQPETFFPKPGYWMHNLEIFMQIMLYLTIAWFLLLMLEQTDWEFVLKFAVIILLFAFVIWICKKFLEYLNGILDERIPLDVLVKIRRGVYVAMLGFFVVCSLICTNMAQTAFQKNYEENMKNRLTFIDRDLIDKHLNDGHPVLVEISADWCLTCHANKMFVFNKTNMKNWKQNYDLEFLRVDWTNYNKEILDYMGKFGRKGLPFYILYTPFVKEGMVLPEIFEESDLSQILRVSKIR
ncbi:MAG: thioredoxin family protein [Alphaproteobacteria bacterium]|nr:thioredoxin family protein [Alphaproteobacteria bacterium]